MASKRSFRPRGKILVPFKLRSPAVPSRSFYQFPAGIAVRIPFKAGDTTVHLFHVLEGSIKTIVCGGKIGASGLQACVVDIFVGSSPYSIKSHSTKEKSLVDNTLYIQTPFVVGNITIYLPPSLIVSSVSPKILLLLLKAKRSVEV